MGKADTLLFVENNRISSYIDKEICKEVDLTQNTVVVEGGIKAIEFINNWRIKSKSQNADFPLVVFLEPQVPELNAPEILKFVQDEEWKNQKEVKIFVLASNLNQRVKSELKGFNVLGFIEKPLTVEKLKVALKKLN